MLLGVKICLIGMGTVFSVLGAIALVLEALRRISQKRMLKRKREKEVTGEISAVIAVALNQYFSEIKTETVAETENTYKISNWKITGRALETKEW